LASRELALEVPIHLPPHLQAHLLRVLDADGNYHRLGESTGRRSNFRLIAATNRPLSALKVDFAARFGLHIRVPTLAERREDVSLMTWYAMPSHGRCAS